MVKERFRFSVTLKKLRKGRGGRRLLATTKSQAKKLGKKFGGKKGFRIRKFKRSKLI